MPCKIIPATAMTTQKAQMETKTNITKLNDHLKQKRMIEK